MRPTRVLPWSVPLLALLTTALSVACHDSSPPAARPSEASAPAPASPAASASSRGRSSPDCTGDGWCTVMSMKGGNLHAIWGTSPKNVFELWSMTLVQFDGRQWAPVPGLGDNRFWAIGGSGERDVWAVGDHGVAAHYDGVWSLTNVGAEESLRGVYGRIPGDTWAVGTHGTIARWNGHAWGASPNPARDTKTDVLSLWVDEAGNGWAVGADGLAMHWDGTRWTTQGTGTSSTLIAVSGSGARDVWAAGDAGTILHFDGAGWHAVPSGLKQTLFALWVENPRNAWVVGSNSTILHWDGASWTRSAFAADFDLHGIWGPLARDLWVAGFSVRSEGAATWRRQL